VTALLPAAEIRATLARKSLADARFRSSLARVLGISENDVLAVQHLAREGALTPSILGVRLGLTSGGTTALLQRLERLGYVQRDAHPTDRRSSLVCLSEQARAEVGDAYAPLVRQLDAEIAELPAEHRDVVRRFLERAAVVGEQQADEFGRRADDERLARTATSVPGLWG
jgi:DNA-binding MarR family transcriptional regulator